MVVEIAPISKEEKERLIQQQADGNSLNRYCQREVYGGCHALVL